MKKFLIFSLFVVAAFALDAQPLLPAQAPFGDGESLSYNVSYRAKLIPPINLMKVTLRTMGEDFGGGLHYHVIGNGRTVNGVSGIFSINDTYHTWLDAVTLRPSRMMSDIHENNYRFHATYNYDWQAMTTYNVYRRESWDADRHATVPLKENSGDAMSLLYRLRDIDTDTLVPGQAYPLDLIFDKNSRQIEFRFIGREEIKVKKIGTFRALKITCTMATSDDTTYEEGMTLTAWISDDENRIPLLIECPIRIGRVVVTLAEGTKAVHPLASRIK
jgi:hypothetical protein